MPRVDFGELVEFGVRYLVRKGMSRTNARFISTMAVTTEATGVTTHGLALLTSLEQVLGTSVDPRREPAMVKDKAAIALLDCEGCAGPVAMRVAMEIAKRKARRYGIAMVGVRNGTWIAGLGFYCLALAREGFFVQLWAQSNGCLDSAPYGGIDARFSTNPVGLAFPTDRTPVVADFSTAVMSMGKVGQLIRRGEKAPEPVFFDRHGNLTDDPRVMRDGGAMFLMGGAINGFKGYAFALWAEALTAMAGGSCNNPRIKRRQSFNLTVIDPCAFGQMDYYRREMKRFVARVKSSRPWKKGEPVRLPGERMLRLLRESEKHGVPLDEERLEQLNNLADKYRIPRLKPRA